MGFGCVVLSRAAGHREVIQSLSDCLDTAEVKQYAELAEKILNDFRVRIGL